jgi:hypothetical protein
MSYVSTLRRVPVPIAEPPYDDEIGLSPRRLHSTQESSPAVQGTLALSFLLPSGLPATPEPPALRLAPPMDDDADFAARPTPRSLLPDPRQWAAQLVQALVEVVAGDRPATQLIRWTTPEVYAEVRQATNAFWHGTSPAAQRLRPGTTQCGRVLVRSIHVCEPADGAAEVCATVQRGARAAAVALRMVGADGRWQCTALQLG